MINILDNYNNALQAVYDYFDFKEGSRVYPLDDRRKYWWKINGSDLEFYNSKEAYDNQDGMNTYEDEIIGNAIYRKSEYTMILAYTITGNRFLAIFDNLKEIK